MTFETCFSSLPPPPSLTPLHSWLESVTISLFHGVFLVSRVLRVSYSGKSRVLQDVCRTYYALLRGSTPHFLLWEEGPNYSPHISESPILTSSLVTKTLNSWFIYLSFSFNRTGRISSSFWALGWEGGFSAGVNQNHVYPKFSIMYQRRSIIMLIRGTKFI